MPPPFRLHRCPTAAPANHLQVWRECYEAFTRNQAAKCAHCSYPIANITIQVEATADAGPTTRMFSGRCITISKRKGIATASEEGQPDDAEEERPSAPSWEGRTPDLCWAV